MARQWLEFNSSQLGSWEQKRAQKRSARRAGAAIAGGLAVCGLIFVAPTVAQLRSPHAMDSSTFVDKQQRPLGRPPEVQHGVGTFAYLETQPRSKKPVAYDPCHKIAYAINTTFAPTGGEEIIEEAVRQVEKATGLVFVRRPDTDEHPDFRSGVHSVERGPVVIDWTSSVAVPELLGFTAGVGGSVSVQESAGGRYYLTGAIALDTHQLETTLPEPNGRAQVRAIVMHELGHVLGLDHVKDRGELMHAHTWGQYEFGPGDREGLAALGSGECF